MWKLLKYMDENRFQTFLAPMFKFMECVFELFVPLIMTRIIDIGIHNSDAAYIFRMCMILILLALVGFLCTTMAQYFAAKASALFVRKVKHAAFDHVQKLSYSQLDQLGTSTLITRLTSDMNQIQTGVNLALRLRLRSPIIVFGAMIMAFTIDVQEALIFAVAIPVLGAVVAGVMMTTLPLFSKVQSMLDTVLRKTRENLIGSRVIRAFNLEEREIEAYDRESENLRKLNIFVGRISAAMNPVTYAIINIAIVILFYLGSVKVDRGNLTSGQVVALYNYMSQILIELIKLASLIITISKAITCGNRVEQILEIEPAIVSNGCSFEGSSIYAVEFRNVTLNYHINSEASLSDISFRVPKGYTVGIIGSTGSGKSSVVNLIPRFYEATKGTVEVNGCDVRDVDVEQLRQLIATVPQKAVLFRGTVRSNLLWGNENATDEELTEALKLSQSYEFIMAKEGLDTPVEQGGRNFSGGQRQRLTIARALVRKPQILILDDSASALDYLTETRLRQAVKDLPYQHTTFIVSQRTSSIRHADMILVLDDGMLVGKGTHEELLNSCEVYKEIYYSQYRREGSDHE
ncbi:MAG: ABC transporter ATP-binding protein [Erysipelotrichaceae bacterium]|nr:ABC transporter ATP-binding protein [Erysipelotrichaceae bacterium]